MSLDAVICAYICRSGFEICFHNAETFFNLPAPLIDLLLSGGGILKICAYSIEPIITGFVLNHTVVDFKNIILCNLPVRGNTGSFYKPLAIILAVFFQRGKASFQKFSCAFYLSVADALLIMLIFQREGHN